MFVLAGFSPSVQECIPDGLSNDIDVAKRSYFNICAILDLLKPNAGACDPQKLEDTVLEYLRGRLVAYTESRYVPKLHFAIHFGQFLRRCKLIPCWTHERKHKDLKRFSTDSCNATTTVAYERGLLRQVTLSQMGSLKDLDIGEGFRLIKPVEASDSLRVHVRSFLGLQPFESLVVSYGMAAFLNASSRCHAKDVIVATRCGVQTVGEVWFFVSANGADYICWSPWVTLGANMFTVCENPEFLAVSSIERCCIFRKDRDGRAMVVP